jgi:MFS-type transporter involved in bile tolerance (Atg22 family)
MENPPRAESLAHNEWAAVKPICVKISRAHHGMTPHHSSSEQRGWYMYDFAQSAFSTTVITLFLGPYLTALAKSAADSVGMVHPLGIDVDARSYWSYLISLSVILQVLFLPVIGAIADYGRRKNRHWAARRTWGQRPRW